MWQKTRMDPVSSKQNLWLKNRYQLAGGAYHSNWEPAPYRQDLLPPSSRTWLLLGPEKKNFRSLKSVKIHCFAWIYESACWGVFRIRTNWTSCRIKKKFPFSERYSIHAIFQVRYNTYKEMMLETLVKTVHFYLIKALRTGDLLIWGIVKKKLRCCDVEQIGIWYDRSITGPIWTSGHRIFLAPD